MCHDEDDDPNESNSRQHPSADLELAGLCLVVSQASDEASSHAEESEDGMTGDGPFAPGARARDDGEGNHKNKGYTGSYVCVVELHDMLVFRERSILRCVNLQ